MEDYKKRRDELTELVQNNFGKASLELFEKHPQIKSFGWRQYEAYNDETTDFEAYIDEDSVIVNDKRRWDEEDNEDPNAVKVPGKIRKEVSKFLNELDIDILREVFGNGSEVTVTRDGVTVDDYDGGY